MIIKNPVLSTLVLLTILCVLPFNLSSQDKKEYKLKWGNVSPEDLKMTSYDEDPNAGAVILGDKGTISFDLSGEDTKVILDRHVRIKILSENGLKWANTTLPFYHHEEEFNSIKGQCIQANGKASKLTKKNINKYAIDEYKSEVNFVIPDVKVGAIIEYKYKQVITSTEPRNKQVTNNREFRYQREPNNVFQLPLWYFQSSIPTKWSQLLVSIPEPFHYLPIKEFTDGITEEGDNYKEIVRFAEYIQNKVGSGYTQPIWEGSIDVTMIMRHYTYTMNKIPAFLDDPLVANPLDYYARIHFQLNARENSIGFIENVKHTWKEYAKDQMENTSFGKQLTNPRNYKKLITAISPKMANAKTNDEKIYIISNFILNNVKWNNKYKFYSEKGISNAFDKKKANSGEMNIMGLALLNHFGVKSHPVLVSTKKNGRIVKTYPIAGQFNHTIIRTNKDSTLFDFSSPLLKNGLIRPEAMNISGLAIIDNGDDNYTWIDIDAPYSIKTMVTKTILDENGGLSGELGIVNDNYTAYINRNHYSSKESEEEYAKRFFKEDLSQTIIEKVEVKNENDKEKKFISKINFSISKFAKTSNDLIYLPVMLDDGWSWIEESLKKEVRNHPLDFPFPFKDKYIMNIKIPEGYLINKIPENTKVVTPDGNFTFSYISSFKGNTLQIVISFSSLKYHYSTEESARIKELFTLITETVNESVVLKKG